MNIAIVVSVLSIGFAVWPPLHPRPAASPPSAPVNPNVPANAEPAKPVEEAKTADELLARLETADRDLHSLSANLKYVTESGAGGIEGAVKDTRVGRIFFVSKAPVDPSSTPERLINVTFDKLFTETKAIVEDRAFILNNGVFVEKSAKDKQVNRYKLGQGGRKIDPLKIGEGPFPLPFGQKPQDIKAQFEVELLPGTDGMEFASEGLKQYYENAYQLKLIPKEGTKAKKEFKEARIWFEKGTLVPFQARTAKLDVGGMDEFMLLDIQTNQPVEESLFDTSTPPGWAEEEKELK